MELKLRINSKNTFPKGGVFIKSALPKVWLQEIQNIGLAFDMVKVFPVPGANANELFGCLLVFDQTLARIDIGKNHYCQLIENKLFIPENTVVTPQLTKAEWHNLFSEHYHFLHSDIGLVELKEEVFWIDLLETPVLKEIDILEPSKTIHIPQKISSLRYEINTEDILEALEKSFSDEEVLDELPFDMEELMKGNQKEMDKFLVFLDKNPEMALKLAIPLDTLGTARGGFDGKFSFDGIDSSFSGGGSFSGGRRNTVNESEFDGKPFIIVFKIIFVLVVLFNLKGCHFSNANIGNNSSLALIIIVFAIGLIIALAVISSDSSSSSGGYSPPPRPSGSGGGSALIDSERFATIQNRYEKIAEEFKERKDYAKAAHVYMKLLKNHYKAADVLEEGELYSEAAAVHLKYCNNKNKAAECYEKGHVYKQAIELYKEINQNEKVGDLYTILKEKPEADKFYGKVIDEYKVNNQYVKASFIYKNKIKDIEGAQDVLIKGWRSNKDALNCLNNYFVNIESTEKLSRTITSIYESDVSAENSELFLQAMKQEFKKHEELEEITKNIAYEIVADKIVTKPDIASELIAFNEKNKSILKDVMKYKLKMRNKV